MPNVLKNIEILEVSGVDTAAGEGCRIVLRKRAKPLTGPEAESLRARTGRDRRLANEQLARDMADSQWDDDDEQEAGKMLKAADALDTFNAEVDRIMRDEKLAKRGDAIDRVMADSPALFRLAKAASADPKSNMTARGTPTAKPRRMDDEPAARHMEQFNAAVAAIMRMQPLLTKSEAIDRAMHESGPRSHFEAAKRLSVAAV